MNIIEIRNYCIECIFGRRYYRDLSIQTRNKLDNLNLRSFLNQIAEDINGIGIGNGETIILFMRKYNPLAQNVCTRIGQVTGFNFLHEITGDFHSLSSRTSRIRPAPGGVSIGHYRITAGTLGCLVKDKQDNVYILSNNHVLANTNKASIGDPIYQPGPYDGGTSKDTIAKLERWIPLVRNSINNVDAAIAKPIKDSDVSREILGIGFVRGIINPKTDLVVRKSGRTTGVTNGVITAINAYVRVLYDSFILDFDDQIIIGTENFSQGGDSGSLILDTKNYAVGLLFAGSETHTVANPIQNVLNSLNLSRIL